MQGGDPEASEPTQEADAKVSGAQSKDSKAAEDSAQAGPAAISSIRVVWTREDEELYRKVLRKHGRSMEHLCAAFPTKYAPAACRCAWVRLGAASPMHRPEIGKLSQTTLQAMLSASLL